MHRRRNVVLQVMPCPVETRKLVVVVIGANAKQVIMGLILGRAKHHAVKIASVTRPRNLLRRNGEGEVAILATAIESSGKRLRGFIDNMITARGIEIEGWTVHPGRLIIRQDIIELWISGSVHFRPSGQRGIQNKPDGNSRDQQDTEDQQKQRSARTHCAPL